MQYQVLQTNIIRNVCRKVRRITDKISVLKGLTEVSKYRMAFDTQFYRLTVLFFSDP